MVIAGVWSKWAWTEVGVAGRGAGPKGGRGHWGPLGLVRLGWPTSTIGVWGQWEGLEGRGQRGVEHGGRGRKWVWPEVGGI